MERREVNTGKYQKVCGSVQWVGCGWIRKSEKPSGPSRRRQHLVTYLVIPMARLSYYELFMFWGSGLLFLRSMGGLMLLMMLKWGNKQKVSWSMRLQVKRQAVFLEELKKVSRSDWSM